MGNSLFNELVQATNLPEHLIIEELEKILLQNNMNKHNLNMEKLRTLMTIYLRSIIADAKKYYQ